MNQLDQDTMQWCLECRGLFDDEVSDIGAPGTEESLHYLRQLGLVRRDEESAMWVPVVN